MDGKDFDYEGQLNAKGQPTGYGKGVPKYLNWIVEGFFLNGKAHGRSKYSSRSIKIIFFYSSHHIYKWICENRRTQEWHQTRQINIVLERVSKV